nr:hypothetical protein [Tanacetum cinerariifolium]
VKEYQEKDKIRSKPNKNEKCGKAEKSQKQLQSVEKVKLKKTQKEWSEMQTHAVPKLRKNRTAHTDYIRHTQEEAATLREIVESERLLSQLNTSLAYACKYTRWIQELLMILQQTCPSITDLATKLVAVTPKNKTKQIRRTAHNTKSEKTTIATSPSANIDLTHLCSLLQE